MSEWFVILSITIWSVEVYLEKARLAAICSLFVIDKGTQTRFFHNKNISEIKEQFI
jgi:hypothetical protein